MRKQEASPLPVERRSAEINPLDFVPDKMPFDTPYGPLISPSPGGSRGGDRGEEAELEDERNGGRFRRQSHGLLNEWTARCLPPFRLPSTRHEQPRPSGAKRSDSRTVSSSCISTYLLAFDGIIASRGGIPLIDQELIIGAIGCSGGAVCPDEIVSKAGAAVINQLPAGNK